MQRKGIRYFAALIAAIMALSFAPAAFAYKTITFGSTGTQVSTLQRHLKSKGYYKGKIDGKFGQKTRSAVYRYQRDIGLTADGKPGNKTLTALYDGISALNVIDGKKKAATVVKNKSTLAYGSYGDKVKTLQLLLRSAGYFKGAIDGKYGDTTLLAVKKYQWAHGLTGDGKAGVKTMASLRGQ